MSRLFIRLSIIILCCLSLSSCSRLVAVTSEEPVRFDPGKRTLGAKIDDEQIEIAAKVNLRKADPGLAAANIGVTSYNGVVLLTGQVNSQQERSLATQVINDIGRVRQVHNELQLTGETSFLAKTNDAWLTTKVKSQLLAIDDIDGGRVKVVSEGATVYLMGLLTQKEAQRVVDVARTTVGVQRVVKVFEYID